MPPELNHLEEGGHILLHGVLSSSEVEELRREAERLTDDGAASRRGGLRGILARSELFLRLATELPPARVAREVLGAEARVRKGTLFDKTPQANWKVPWHQDLAIAVAERKDVGGFTAWSVKDGVHHVQPPVEILEKVLAIRVHLDDAGDDNGALRVIPGSHRHGRLDDASVARLRTECGDETCVASAGDLHLFYPLLLHASSASGKANHRRVLHFEYSAITLPGGLAWAPHSLD